MDNAYFSYQATVAYYRARLGLAYPVIFSPVILLSASTNAANVMITNVNEKRTVDQTEKNPTTSENSDDVQTNESRMKWNYKQISTLIPFLKNNTDNIESPISNNIWEELKLQVDQQGPTKTIKQCKAKLRTLKDPYKKDTNMKTGTTPVTYLFYNNIDEILVTRDVVKLPEFREVGMYEDDHSDSITKDAENLEEKGTIRKQSVAKVNIITDHSDREMDESVIDHENHKLNSSFIDVLNH